ncbi:MAG: replication-associated recombination protein A [Proteobacteria bacterium]|nr:replication-associated recombination protein A [Pseudomonadota bacterium]MBU1740465.1 replication-associated recombination protein A [Pseudomonadota bacterium]
MDLFDPLAEAAQQQDAPLAQRLRPRSLDDFFGQTHLVGPGKILRRLAEAGTPASILFWGPPGSGKTTLARIMASHLEAKFVTFSAVLSGVADIRAVVDLARQELKYRRNRTVLFVDEIHRFNKVQQDAFLPHVESGLLTLMGATTENPSFEVRSALLSRCRVLVLHPLTEEDLHHVARRAITNTDQGLGPLGLTWDQDALELLVQSAYGDARRLLNGLELAAGLARTEGGANQDRVTRKIAAEAVQQKTLRYDQSGEEHFNLISALHKSLRDSDPDAALYWFYRMLDAGEDPRYIARRLTRFASEDVGLADPGALRLALDAWNAYERLGSPEGDLALAQLVVWLAAAPKSNSVYAAQGLVRRDIERYGPLPVPLVIRNAPTRLMKDLGYGRDYQYAHDDPDAAVVQDLLPDELADRIYYQPTARGIEARIKKYLDGMAAQKKSRGV